MFSFPDSFKEDSMHSKCQQKIHSLKADITPLLILCDELLSEPLFKSRIGKLLPKNDTLVFV